MNDPVETASSPSQIERRARAHKRRILRRLGVRASDLDALTSERLAAYVDVKAHRDALPGDSALRWTASNTTARELAKLEQRLREIGLAGPKSPDASPLERYLSGNGDRG